MKQLQMIGWVMFAAILMVACKNVRYKTTESGLKYKLFEGSSKDSTHEGDVLKMNMMVKLTGHKDTVMWETYGKMPYFAKIQAFSPDKMPYAPDELFHLLKKGDSLVVVTYIDSAIKKGLAQEAQLPPYIKKGDKITYYYKVLEVFKNDSIANLDYVKEMEKDAPRQKKEEEEQMKKMRDEQAAAVKKEEAELEKSGEKAAQLKQIEDYLGKKHITATKTPVGVFVKMDEVGTGEQAADGKFVTLTYTGKKLVNDSTFEGPNPMTFKVGTHPMILGFEDGIKQFKKGGKGVIYIPGYLAYGKTPPAGSPFKAYEPLYFEIKIDEVSDKEPAPPVPAPPVEAPAKPEPTKKK